MTTERADVGVCDMRMITLADVPGYVCARTVAEPLLDGTQPNGRVIRLGGRSLRRETGGRQ